MDVRRAGDRIEQLLSELHDEPRAEELVRIVTDLYGTALETIVDLARSHAPPLLPLLVNDELVASLLLVHGLHPDDIVSRVERGLASVRPFLAQHHGDVELLGVDPEAGAVLIRLLGNCDGCPSSAVTLQTAVEQAVVEAAPEITRIDVDESGVRVVLSRKTEYDSCPTP